MKRDMHVGLIEIYRYLSGIYKFAQESSTDYFYQVCWFLVPTMEPKIQLNLDKYIYNIQFCTH